MYWIKLTINQYFTCGGYTVYTIIYPIFRRTPQKNILDYQAYSPQKRPSYIAEDHWGEVSDCDGQRQSGGPGDWEAHWEMANDGWWWLWQFASGGKLSSQKKSKWYYCQYLFLIMIMMIMTRYIDIYIYIYIYLQYIIYHHIHSCIITIHIIVAAVVGQRLFERI